MPTRRRHTLAAALLPATLLVTAAACGGGGGDDGGDVASLAGDDSAEGASTDTTLSPDELEDALVDWAQCMRDEGIDVPDPTVDEDGNLVLGGGPGGPPPGGGEAGTDGEAPADRPDRDTVEAARDVCGDPPEGAFGGDAGENREDFQDDALAFAECMRDEGIADFPDPDLSDMGPGGGPPPEDGDDAGSDSDIGGGGGGPFGGAVDMDDPEVQAAMEACQDELGELGRQGGPGSGSPDDGGADGSET